VARADNMPERKPIPSAMATRNGIVKTPAMMRGAARAETGSRPSEYKASICSETRIRADLGGDARPDASDDDDGRQDPVPAPG